MPHNIATHLPKNPFHLKHPVTLSSIAVLSLASDVEKGQNGARG